MLDTVKEMAHKHCQGARSSHNWDHTLRVYRLCEHLGSAEGVDFMEEFFKRFIEENEGKR